MLMLGLSFYRLSFIVADTTVHFVSCHFQGIICGWWSQSCQRSRFTSPDQATFSKRCYPRTALPGCKGKLFRFEKEMLHQIAMTTFAIVPVHLFNIFVALLCANHVNRSFGKGLMPRQYRLR
jgi:hypothetical protein